MCKVKVFASILVFFPLNLICNMTTFRIFFTFSTIPQVEGVCKERIRACMVLYAPFPLIWYTTWPCSEKVAFRTIDPTPGSGG